MLSPCWILLCGFSKNITSQGCQNNKDGLAIASSTILQCACCQAVWADYWPPAAKDYTVPPLSGLHRFTMVAEAVTWLFSWRQELQHLGGCQAMSRVPFGRDDEVGPHPLCMLGLAAIGGMSGLGVLLV